MTITSATPTPTKVTKATSAVEQAVLDQRLELVDVGRHPGHDPAGHLALVVVERRRCSCAQIRIRSDNMIRWAVAAGDEGLTDLVDQVGERDDEVRGGRGEKSDR